MVEIPVFTSKNDPQRIAGQAQGVPGNLVGAATLPYEATARLGSTMTEIGSNLYKQQIDQDLKKYELGKTFESEKYTIQKEQELKEYELRENAKVEHDKLTLELKTNFEIKKIELERETAVKSRINGSLSPINELTTEANNNPNTSIALQQWEDGVAKLKENLSKGLNEQDKLIFEMEFDQMIAQKRVNVESQINKNALANNFITFENEVNILKNQALYGNANEKTDAWIKLLGENSIIDKKFVDGLLYMEINGETVPVTPDVYKESIKKEIFSIQADMMSTDNPDHFKGLIESGYWDDKLDANTIKNYLDQADRVIAANNADTITGLKTQKTTYNNLVADFTDVSSASYFGDWNTFDQLMLKGEALMKSLEDAGEINAALEVANDLKKLASAGDAHNTIKMLSNQPIEEVRTFLNNVNQELLATSGTDKFDQGLADQVPHIEKLLTYMENNINNDIIGMVEKLNGVSVPPINFQEQNFETFVEQANGYKEFVMFNMEKYNRVEPQFFRPDDLKNFQNIFENGNAEEIYTLVRNISAVAGEWSNSAFTQISKSDAPEMAHLGMLLNANGGVPTKATDAILNGFIALRNPDNAKLVGGLNLLADSATSNFRSISEELIGDLINNAPDTFNNITQSANIIMADMILKDASLREAVSEKSFQDDGLEEAWRMSLQLASGLVFKSDGAYGGIEMYNEHPIIIPQEKKNGTLKDAPGAEFTLEFLLENYLTDELLFEATADIGELSGGAEGQGYIENLPYDFAGKKNISVENLFKEDGFENIFLETADYGEYYITFKNPGDPAHEYYQNEKGQNIILNLNRIYPKLLMAARQAGVLPNISIEFGNNDGKIRGSGRFAF